MFFESLLLGLSTGTHCTMYCAPVLVPFLLGAEKSLYKRNASLVGVFLLCRLATYFVMGAVFAALGFFVTEYLDPFFARRLSVFAYIFSGLSLLFNSLGIKFPWSKCGGEHCKAARFRRIGNDWVTAILSGFAVGLHICPALWTAMLRSIFCGNGMKGLFYFVFFYIGTLPFFVPLLGIPFVTKRVSSLKRIARVTQFCISIYFLIFLGMIELFFG